MSEIFKTRTFERWQRKSELINAALCSAVLEMEQGIIDADLGDGVFKKRIALPGRGKRAGARVLVATRLMPRKATSRILNEMLETSQGLHAAGLIDQRCLSEIKALCTDSVEPLSPTAIRGLREHLHISQSVFAMLLNTPVSTIKKWETGDKKPSGPSLKLLHVVKRHGLSALS